MDPSRASRFGLPGRAVGGLSISSHGTEFFSSQHLDFARVRSDRGSSAYTNGQVAHTWRPSFDGRDSSGAGHDQSTCINLPSPPRASREQPSVDWTKHSVQANANTQKTPTTTVFFLPRLLPRFLPPLHPHPTYQKPITVTRASDPTRHKESKAGAGVLHM